MAMWELIKQLRQTVVFLGKITEDNSPKFTATGFLVQIEKLFHLVTARHVVTNPKTNEIDDGSLYVFLNSKDGNLVSRSVAEMKSMLKTEWIFHENTEVDIAIIPFALDPKNDNIRMIPENLFLDMEDLSELYEVFFLSYQPGTDTPKKVRPVLRGGVVSLINEDQSFYIDGAAFPGNSGSPVFLKPSAIRFRSGGISIGGDTLGGKFAGIIGSYVPYQEVAVSTQTGRPRIIFEENTGLSMVWSVSIVKQILEQDNFKQQLSRVIKERTGHP